MANFFRLTLDTLAPVISAFTINSGAAVTTSANVTLAITCSDADVATMKIWGIDGAKTEAEAKWETFAATKTVKLPSTTDGSYTINVKVRDDVYNESATKTASITLSTALPEITITGPDVSKISEVTGKNIAQFTFTCNVDISEWKVKIVPGTNSAQNTGTQIAVTNGSTGMTGGALTANKAQSCSINGSDFKAAAGGSDGQYIVKVFAKSAVNGLWSA